MIYNYEKALPQLIVILLLDFLIVLYYKLQPKKRILNFYATQRKFQLTLMRDSCKSR